MQKDGEDCLQGTKLGIEALYKRVMKSELQGSHFPDYIIAYLAMH